MTRSLLLLTLLAATTSFSFAKPNFTGEWKVDSAKSDFGDMPAPDSIVMQIDHADPKLIMKQFQSGGPLGELKADMTYQTDGTESKNTVRGSEILSTGKWSGDALKINTKMAWQGQAVNVVETWKLTSGGKNLEILREINSEGGGSTMKLVFTKSDKK
jgi:hypothetical protein